LHFDPSPAEALPQQTFATVTSLRANGEILALQHLAPAHTDSDIYVSFQKANVISMGDLFFNGMYPYIDPGTGAQSPAILPPATKFFRSPTITPRLCGHGPLGNKADLTKFRDLLITSRDRVQKLKSAGKISPGSRRGKAVCRSRPRLGQRHHQLRAVDPNRLSDALSLRLSIFLTSNLSNQFAKGATK